MQITVSNEIIIQSPTSEVRKFCKDNLVIPNPDYFKKQRMGFWVGNTPQVLYLYRRDVNKLYLPVGCINNLKKVIPLNTHLNYDFAENSSVDYNCKLPLYDYQETAMGSVLNTNFGILQAPCGSGKTQVGISLAVNLHKKTLWLTHTRDLLTQSYKRAAQYMDKSLLGTITGGKVDISEGITFATVQTMSKLDLTQYKYTWDVVIVDECHRVAGTPTSLTMFSKVINNLAARYKYGLSATVHRGDGLIKSTFALLGNVVYVVPEEAVADKTINVTVQEVKTGIKISESCLDTDGTIIYTELVNYLAENPVRNRLIASKIVENKKHNNLILSDRLQHLRDIIKCLMELGIPESEIRMIDGSMTSKKAREARGQALEDMKTGMSRFLFASYSLGKEGLDIPNLDRLYLVLPKKDYAVVTQSIGRIGRISPGKDSAICYDFVDKIGFCEGSWKKRKSAYKKKGCEIIEGIEPVIKDDEIQVQKSLFEFAV